ncbi:uncharacterized protein BO66DRAFT_412185 [Aspergillus aculeatinus CBS 121060]|uniref:Uncharacterized protein n=1 Tax=Aspergillus aculeatinus CBS 121060 TaxID=1448322 RepID=A0ACD1H7E7_9EURO|nr:hypothetical protein BO66DRAFT_412185 [Aspergillus aculeatinus CBS 121060]RAH69337.1 hypothetical protein BO66DRAFT_412185 [Aspergillus aculeatinus CBS 121060]
MSSSSGLSLPRPTSPQHLAKRRLLLIYIHGFEGSEASFSDFPAHVHTALTDLLSESHLIYTRVYPRYKSRGELRTAVENFSEWLSPHVADDLDVILLGHSLGGILAADVALLPSPFPSQSSHRILGLVNFDVPFLGLHPHVIPTGLRGLWQPKQPNAEAAEIGQQDTTLSDIDLCAATAAASAGPLFDPPFANDVHLVERDRIDGMLHFIHKNHHDLPRSIYKRLVSSQLRRRYRQLKALGMEEYPRRVHWINYYTLSTATTRTSPRGILKHKDHAQTEPAETNSKTAVMQTWSILSEEQSLVVPADNLELNTSSSSLAESEDHDDVEDGMVLSTKEISMAASDDSPNITLENTHIQRNNVTPARKERCSGKPRKFVLLPSHHWKHGDDSLWIPVPMEHMDEVTAHQSMFLSNSGHYARLVGEVVSQVQSWIQDDLSERAVADRKPGC